MDVPIKAAQDFCEQYQKDQVIILSWDKRTSETWFTTYGKSDEDSAQAAKGGEALAEFLGMKLQNNEIPTRFQKWEIESVKRYWYLSGRNQTTYVELTHWYDPITLQRKETKRQQSIYDRCEHELEDWAKGITERNRKLDDQKVY